MSNLTTQEVILMDLDIMALKQHIQNLRIEYDEAHRAAHVANIRAMNALTELDCANIRMQDMIRRLTVKEDDAAR